jgi:uncharacterized protein YndB with AHSA1/START domain
MAADQAKVMVRVSASPARAFEAFTRDINLWWQRGPRFRNAPGDQGLMCMEPRLGGWVFESFRQGDAETVIEIGRITHWDPPHRLCFDWRNANLAPDEVTQVEITFAAQGDATLVTVVHSGWSHIRPDHPARHGQDDAAFLRSTGIWWADTLRSLERTLQRKY